MSSIQKKWGVSYDMEFSEYTGDIICRGGRIIYGYSFMGRPDMLYGNCISFTGSSPEASVLENINSAPLSFCCCDAVGDDAFDTITIAYETVFSTLETVLERIGAEAAYYSCNTFINDIDKDPEEHEISKLMPTLEPVHHLYNVY